MSIYAEYFSISNIFRKQPVSSLPQGYGPKKSVDRLKRHTFEVPGGLTQVDRRRPNLDRRRDTQCSPSNRLSTELSAPRIA
jgi:hypothetical protein